MKRMLIGLLALLSACAAIPKPSLGESPKGSVDYFTDKRGCILLYNMRTEVFDRVIGESCSDEFPAASTFKIPLAVMAFDSGILQDENSILKWSGKKEKRKILNRDQDAKSWMSQSVVWFSQRLTTTLGEARLQQYLDNFNYGNKDISAGLADAWLVSPSQKGRGLRLSPYQQIDFLKKLWTSRLPVSERSMQLARELLFLETTPNGLRVSGKTGSGHYLESDRKHMGWFVAHLHRGDEQYLIATQFSDLTPGSFSDFPGARARNITMTFLQNEGLL